MRPISYSFILLFCFLLTACTFNPSENVPSNIEGHWLNKEYLEALQNNHSPQEVANSLSFYTTELVLKNSVPDSITVFNGQVEFTTLPYKRSGDTLRLKLNRDAQTEIIYTASDKTLSFIDKGLNRVFRFVRADSSLIDRSYTPYVAFPSAVNKNLLEGSWEIVEADAAPKIIQADKFGHIKDWEKYSNYTMCINGDCAANESGDVIFFSNKDISDQYGFHSKGDTITIFQMKQINDPDEKPVYQNTQPLFTLVRKKAS